MVPVHLIQKALETSLPEIARFAPRAYLDPGSGSILLQLLVAGILGGLFAARAFWGRLRAKLTRKPRGEEEEEGRG
jgi:hypothetical protein